jgi:hypothetical protein
VAFGYISPSSAGEIGIELGYYIISAWTDITGSVVDSVTDDGGGVVSVNNSDPENPIVGFDGVYVGSGISGDGTSGNPLISTAGGYTVINVSTTPYTVIPVTGQIIYNVDTTAFSITMNFPTAVGNTAAYTVNNRGANSVIIDPFGAQTINGNANQTLLFQNTSVDIYTDNSNLFIR